MDNGISLWVIASCAAFLNTPTTLAADTPTTNHAKQAVETFTPPELERTKKPLFPRSSQIKGHEGWVNLSMMIDTNGEPYDVTVTSSSGEPAFEKSAVAAASKWQYQPAELGSAKIDAAVRTVVTFELSGPTGASSAYTKSYRKLNSAIEADDQTSAEKLLTTLADISHTLYEQAYWRLGQYQYERKWGSSQGQYAALNRATFLNGDRGYLPDESLTSLLAARFNLELEASLYAKARATATSLLARKLDDGLRAGLERVQREIDNLEVAEGTIVVSGNIDNSNYFGHDLLRGAFAFRNVEGDIAELRLHCDKGYVGFVYDAGISYNVEPGYRDCSLTAIGTPGTTFQLVELSPGEE